MRITNSVEKSKALKIEAGKVTSGKVVWYDHRDAIGVIHGDDNNAYQFSMGLDGHIGVSTANYVVDGSVLKSGDRVEFIPVDVLACDIKLIK